ncbi:alpha-sarcoglycan [Eudromia elegans]
MEPLGPLLLWALAALALGGAALPELRLSADAGAVFVHELRREPFEEALVAAHEDDDDAVPVGPVTFQARLGGHPDLPRWLRLAQRGPSVPAYLYGAPQDGDAGAHVIEVLAYSRATYETVAQRVIVTVVPSPAGPPRYQGEFLVANRDVEELLPPAARRLFTEAARGVWPRGDLAVLNVTSALHRGARVPLPIEGRKEGVYVTVGSRGAFSQCLVAAASPQSRLRCRLGQQPVAPCYDTFAPRFSIAWCNLSLLEAPGGSATPGPPPRGPGVLEEGGDFAPPTAAPAADLLPGALLTLLLPLLLAALLGLLLGHLMCCRREGVQKRDKETPELQLVHHGSVRGDAEELRRMAGARAGAPRPLSTLPMFNVRTGQRVPPARGPPDAARRPLLQ